MTLTILENKDDTSNMSFSFTVKEDTNVYIKFRYKTEEELQNEAKLKAEFKEKYDNLLDFSNKEVFRLTGNYSSDCYIDYDGSSFEGSFIEELFSYEEKKEYATLKYEACHVKQVENGIRVYYDVKSVYPSGNVYGKAYIYIRIF